MLFPARLLSSLLYLLLLQLLLLDGCLDGGSLQLPETAAPSKPQDDKPAPLSPGGPLHKGRNKGAPAASSGGTTKSSPGPPAAAAGASAEGEKVSEGPEASGLSGTPPGPPKPFIVWEAKDKKRSNVRFYRGRKFMSQLAYTLDHAGGVWVYLLPKQKVKVTEEKSSKGAKAAATKPKHAAQRQGPQP